MNKSFPFFLEELDKKYQAFQDQYRGLSYTMEDLFSFFLIPPFYFSFMKKEKVLELAYQVRSSIDFDNYLNYMYGKGKNFTFNEEFLKEITELDSFGVDFPMIETLAKIKFLTSQEYARKK